ncbi:MAG: DUF4148 domain-containing protein [Cytophagales bacterium]|nr:DUF4148 domain-containing protein [Rhizobacter sp.]
MNTKQAIAAAVIALVGAPAAFAQSEAELQHFGAQQVSTVSRAEVRADVQQASIAGVLSIPSEVLAAGIAPKASRFAAVNRAQARADVISARAELAVPTEVAMFAKQSAANRDRQDVRAEAREYARSNVVKSSGIGAGY